MYSGQIGICLFLCAGVVSGQAFEVASIRLSGPKSVRGSEGGPGTKDPSRYAFSRASLDDLILIAYQVELFQISSKLPLDRDEFDLTARIPAGASKEDFRAMLRNLLADRFHAKLHIESRDFSAFELVLAKGGTKLGTGAALRFRSEGEFPQLAPGKPGIIGRNSASKGGGMLTQIRGQQQPVSRLAEFLRSAEPRPVVDKTGLTGKYDFTLQFATEAPGGTTGGVSKPAGAPDLNTALREQLGLQIVAKKLPFHVVVVESFDRLPTEN